MNDTRTQILNVAFDLFMRSNFKEVTIKDIVQRTGMSQGAFFHYFKTKEQLFEEIIDGITASATEVYSKLRRDSLYNFYHDYVDWFIGNVYGQYQGKEEGAQGLNYISLFFDALKHAPGFRERLLEVQHVELKAWKDMIDIARKTGEIKSAMDDELIAKVFVYSSDGVSMRNIFMQGSADDAKKLLLALWDGFYEALKA